MEGKMKPIEDRIGVSTLCMRGIPIEEAVVRISRAGFKAIEVVPVKVQRDANIDYWLEYFDVTKRREMKSLLEPFEIVTVHSSGLGVNICHENGVERRRAADRYNALMEFAADINARNEVERRSGFSQVVTFHSGRSDNPAMTDKYHIEYGRIAAEYATANNLVAGYEFFRPEVIAQIDSPHFGINFDIGHAAQRMPPSRDECTQGVLSWIAKMMDVIVEFHVHGVYTDGTSMFDHQPFHNNNALDYGHITSFLAGKYQGPLMFEIVSGDAEASLADCVCAKKQLLMCS